MEMQLQSFLLVLFVCMAEAIGSPRSLRNLLTAAKMENCKPTICYRGGVQGSLYKCDRTEKKCPPCWTRDGGCFELDSTTDLCAFGTDCSKYKGGNDSSSKGNGKTDGSVASETTTPPDKGTKNDENSSKSTETNSKSPNSGSSDLPVILGIIGGAVFVIAIGFAMFTLVKRSSNMDDNDEMDTPNQFYKGSPSVSQGAGYSASKNPSYHPSYAVAAANKNKSFMSQAHEPRSSFSTISTARSSDVDGDRSTVASRNFTHNSCNESNAYIQPANINEPMGRKPSPDIQTQQLTSQPDRGSFEF